MKKIIWYLLGSLAVSLGFIAADVITGKVILNQQDNIFGIGGGDLISGSGLSGTGLLGGTGLRILKPGNFSTESIGICSNNAPLLLADGSCVSCDFKPKNGLGADILMGCEKCPNLQNKAGECSFDVGARGTVARNQNKVEKPVESVVKKSQPTIETHKYKIIKMMGVEDKIFLTIKENATGRKKTLTVGDSIDGGVVKSISLDDGIIVEKDGRFEFLDIGM